MAVTGQSRETLLYGVYVKHNKVSRNEVEPLPPALQATLDMLEADGIFTPAERPDTCCINMYETGSWIPPHVDSEAFARPFCTVSLRSVQPVVFGNTIAGSNGDWSAGPVNVLC
jgi:alkylated DNA repair dioxygenase AlkB